MRFVSTAIREPAVTDPAAIFACDLLWLAGKDYPLALRLLEVE